MSRRIDSSVPLTEEEKEYLLSRAEGAALIAIDERKFGSLSKADKRRIRLGQEVEEDPSSKEEGTEYNPEDVEKVEGLTLAQLRSALKKNGIPFSVTEGEIQEFGTEKEVLAVRLLNLLDDRRKAND